MAGRITDKEYRFSAYNPGSLLMSFEHYKEVIDEICKVTLIPNPASMYEMASLNVREVDFSIVYQDEAPSGKVIVYCDYGVLPLENREAIMRRLLEINLYLFSGEYSPSLSINPETERVVLGCSQNMAALTAQSLLDYMGHLAEMAHQWRATGFIEEKKSNRAPSSRTRL